MVWYCTLTGMHLWHSDYGTFIRETQLNLCRRLITVPLSTFHRLADLIGDPKGELVFLFSMARCGSTLLTQVVRKNVDNPHGSSRAICGALRCGAERHHTTPQGCGLPWAYALHCTAVPCAVHVIVTSGVNEPFVSVGISIWG